MKKFKCLFYTFWLACSLNLIAQPTTPPPMQPMERPSVYQQVDEVRKALQLDQSQFDKVYNAYEKYNKAVFGEEGFDGQLQGPPPGGRGGGPGGRPPGGGGFGGPGGGMGTPGGGPGGGMGGPGGMAPGGMGGNPHQFNGNPPADGGNKNIKKPLSQKEIEKMQKNIAKQEGKLEKTMQKLFKKDPEKYAEWQRIRERQLSSLFPDSPDHDMER